MCGIHYLCFRLIDVYLIFTLYYSISSLTVEGWRMCFWTFSDVINVVWWIVLIYAFCAASPWTPFTRFPNFWTGSFKTRAVLQNIVKRELIIELCGFDQTVGNRKTGMMLSLHWFYSLHISIFIGYYAESLYITREWSDKIVRRKHCWHNFWFWTCDVCELPIPKPFEPGGFDYSI